jgi:hypothetical protein
MVYGRLVVSAEAEVRARLDSSMRRGNVRIGFTQGSIVERTGCVL